MKQTRARNRKEENIFGNIAVNGQAIVKDMNVTKTISRNHPSIFDKNNGFLKIYWNRGDKESAIIPREGVKIVPLFPPDSIRIKSSKFKKFGFFRY